MAATGCAAWGIDPAEKMLEGARRQAKGGGVSLAKGRAEKLAFAEESFDLVFSVDVIHVMENRNACFEEAFRALRRGGRMCTVTDSEEIIRGRLPMGRYFPEAVAVDLVRYPKIAELEEMMRKAGFQEAGRETVGIEIPVTDISVWRNRACSSLQLIPDGAFTAGLRKMEADLEHGPITWRSRYEMIWGKKAG